MKYPLLQNKTKITLKPSIESDIYKLPDNIEKIFFTTKITSDTNHINRFRYNLYLIKDNKIVKSKSDSIKTDKTYSSYKDFLENFTHISFINNYDTNDKYNIEIIIEIEP